MEPSNTYEPTAWPRDFDFRAELSEQQELLDTEDATLNEAEGNYYEQD